MNLKLVMVWDGLHSLTFTSSKGKSIKPEHLEVYRYTPGLTRKGEGYLDRGFKSW